MDNSFRFLINSNIDLKYRDINEYIKIEHVSNNYKKKNDLNFSKTYKQFDKAQSSLVLVTDSLFVESDFCAKRRIIDFVGDCNK